MYKRKPHSTLHVVYTERESRPGKQRERERERERERARVAKKYTQYKSIKCHKVNVNTKDNFLHRRTSKWYVKHSAFWSMFLWLCTVRCDRQHVVGWSSEFDQKQIRPTIKPNCKTFGCACVGQYASAAARRSRHLLLNLSQRCLKNKIVSSRFE